MAETESGDSVHETRFEAAVKVIQSLPKNGSFQPTNEMMLKFYSFYKQATQGPCNIPRPGFWDPIGRYKCVYCTGRAASLEINVKYMRMVEEMSGNDKGEVKLATGKTYFVKTIERGVEDVRSLLVDAWNALGDMPKEEAMIAYVEEMKKILETMPVTDRVEELLHVLGPFYEIVEDKKNRASAIISGPGTAITSVPAVNGKSESSDSGAESEEVEIQEEAEELKEMVEGLNTELSESKTIEEEATAAKELEGIVTNGCYEDDSDIPNSDLANGIQTKSDLNGINEDEEIKKKNKHLELPIRSHFGSYQQGLTEDTTEEVSGIQHLTSDSDSEVYCDSMEQFGQEELLEISPSNNGSSKHHFPLSQIGHGCLPETAGFLELGNYKSEGAKEAAIEGKGEVKCGGEDGKASDGGPHQDKKGGEKVDFYGMRRGRGHRMPPVGDGTQRGQMGSGGDGERWGSDRGPRSSLNEQIAIVLIRLQEDMQNVFQRLNTLETLTASQARTATLHSSNQTASPVKRPSWWPFEISPGTLAFAVLWPFVAQWLVHIYLQRRRRKEI